MVLEDFLHRTAEFIIHGVSVKRIHRGLNAIQRSDYRFFS